MIPLLADENFNSRILRGLSRRASDVDMLSVRAVDLGGRSDADVLAWAAGNGRAVVTHDVNTMIAAALDRINLGRSMPGLIAVPQDLAIGIAIAELALIAVHAEPSDLEGQIWYLPLH